MTPTPFMNREGDSAKMGGNSEMLEEIPLVQVRSDFDGNAAAAAAAAAEGRFEESDEQAGLLLPLNGNKYTNGLERYARTETLAKYIPEVARENVLRRKMSKQKTMLMAQLIVAGVVVATNVGITVWAVVHHPPDWSGGGEGTLSFGNCSSITAANSSLHVLLNILSSLFLGAGNYSMQVLISPSRPEINRAHSKGASLEIGVASIKNLRHVHWKRVLMWLLTGLVATILHLFWNSAIFTSIPAVSIPRAVVTSDFMVAADNWTLTDPLPKRTWWNYADGRGDGSHNMTPVYSLQTQSIDFTRLETKECLERFIDPLTANSALVVVARNITSINNNGSSLIDGWISGWDNWWSSTGWICSGYQSKDNSQWKFCGRELVDTFGDDWVLGWPENILIDYCLAGEQGNNNERCGLHYSASILAFVCICTLLESLLIFWNWFYHHKNERMDQKRKGLKMIVTMGDAIDEFLDTPMDDEASNANKTRNLGPLEVRVAPWHVKRRIPWFKGVSTPIWVISLLLFVMGVGGPTVSLASSMIYLKKAGVDMSLSGLWKQGFKVHAATLSTDFLNGSHSNTVNFLGNLLIANSLQLMVSFLYIFYNNILTRQLVADEWIRFLRPDGKKPLRVSSPDGMQRSSYFLSLPLKYSIPLMTASILLHWLVSQSIFVVRASAFEPGPDGARLPEYDKSIRAYSPLATIIAVVTGFLLVVAILLHSLVRHYDNIPNGFPRMGYNSLAIGMVCQRPEADLEARMFPIRLGIVSADKTMPTTTIPSSMGTPPLGRLTFSTAIDIESPKPGSEYIQPVFVRQRGGVMAGRFIGRLATLAANTTAGVTQTWRRAGGRNGRYMNL